MLSSELKKSPRDRRENTDHARLRAIVRDARFKQRAGSPIRAAEARLDKKVGEHDKAIAAILLASWVPVRRGANKKG
jgi:hypothetical protein